MFSSRHDVGLYILRLKNVDVKASVWRGFVSPLWQ